MNEKLSLFHVQLITVFAFFSMGQIENYYEKVC